MPQVPWAPCALLCLCCAGLVSLLSLECGQLCTTCCACGQAASLCGSLCVVVLRYIAHRARGRIDVHKGRALKGKLGAGTGAAWGHVAWVDTRACRGVGLCSCSTMILYKGNGSNGARGYGHTCRVSAGRPPGCRAAGPHAQPAAAHGVLQPPRGPGQRARGGVCVLCAASYAQHSASMPAARQDPAIRKMELLSIVCLSLLSKTVLCVLPPFPGAHRARRLRLRVPGGPWILLLTFLDVGLWIVLWILALFLYMCACGLGEGLGTNVVPSRELVVGLALFSC